MVTILLRRDAAVGPRPFLMLRQNLTGGAARLTIAAIPGVAAPRSAYGSKMPHL
jgi:hypothetical protein